MKHDFEIIDFHTHPFLNSSYNICNHKEVLQDMGVENTLSLMKDLGVSKICGASFRWIRRADQHIKTTGKELAIGTRKR